MRKAVAIHVLLLSLIAVSAAQLRCNQTVIEPEQETESEQELGCLVHEQFCGSWNWINSCGGFAGVCFTPDSEGQTQRLHLKETGDYEVLVDNTLQLAGKFSIAAADSRFMIWYETDFAPWYERQWIRLHGLDTLLLSDECCDGFSHTYIRIGND